MTTTTDLPAAAADPARTSSRWSAWHLHLASSARSLQDRVVLDVAVPVAAAAGTPWFFVRYWRAGPHVRLRIRDLPEAAAADVGERLAERLAGAGRLQAGEDRVRPDEHQAAALQLVAAGEASTGSEVEGLLEPGVYPRPYEPELDRYGGPSMMGPAEELFHLSSELAHRALRPSPSTGARAAFALRAVASATSALSPGAERHQFAGLGLAAWRNWVAGLGVPPAQLDRLCSPGAGRGGAGGEAGLPGLEELARALPPWQAAMERHVHDARRLTAQEPGRLLFSHVHMLHNRLGLSPVEEVQTYARLVGLAGLAGPGVA